MNKFDYRAARLLSIVILICFIFIMVIWNAFNYLSPQEQADRPLPDIETESVEEPETVNTEEVVKEESEETTKLQVKIEPTENKSAESIKNEKQFDLLEPISENEKEDPVKTAGELFTETFNQGINYTKNEQYSSAISEYQKALTFTDNTKQKAQCYEEIARNYAIMRRYGTALSFAQKAYNLSPSSSREVLLARIYYKTGETEKAAIRMENVLKRDFDAEK